MTTSPAWITTTEVAAVLGITRQAVLARVARGELAASYKSPPANGAYLFDARMIAQLAATETPAR